MMEYKSNAYAKINLYLDITGKRADGYHEIVSVMQSISLCDVLTLVLTNNEGINITISGSDTSLPCDERNLVYKAAKAFCDATGNSPHFDFHIDKRIPVCAGLAGGSTDAACALRLLNEAYGFPLTDSELSSIGAKLGADVPFCLTGGTVLCTGIGEILEPLTSLPSYRIVLAIGGEGVSTPTAYGAIDALEDVQIHKCDNLLSAVKSKDFASLTASVYNVFEKVVLPHHSVAGKLKETLLDTGAEGALMSGSGPSVFGFFDDDAKAFTAAEKLRMITDKVFICELK